MSSQSGWCEAPTSSPGGLRPRPLPISFRGRTAGSSSPSLSRRDFTLIGTTDQRLSRRSRRRRGKRRRGRLSLLGRERLFRADGDPRRHRLDLFGRAAALRRRRVFGPGRRPATMSWRSTRRRRRPAQHFRGQDHHLPSARGRRRSTSLRRTFPAAARRTVGGRRCPAAIFRWTACRRWSPSARSASLSGAGSGRSGWPAAYGTARRSCSTERAAMADLGRCFGAGATRARGRLADPDQSAPKPRPISSGAARSSACALTADRGRCDRSLDGARPFGGAVATRSIRPGGYVMTVTLEGRLEGPCAAAPCPSHASRCRSSGAR